MWNNLYVTIMNYKIIMPPPIPYNIKFAKLCPFKGEFSCVKRILFSHILLIAQNHGTYVSFFCIVYNFITQLFVFPGVYMFFFFILHRRNWSRSFFYSYQSHDNVYCTTFNIWKKLHVLILNIWWRKCECRKRLGIRNFIVYLYLNPGNLF